MSKILDFKPVEVKAYIRPSQDKKLEKIKYKSRIEKNMKIAKTEIIRASLDYFFEMDVNEILKVLSERDNPY